MNGKEILSLIEDFALSKLGRKDGGNVAVVLRQLASLGLEAAINEANTARVSADVLVVRDERVPLEAAAALSVK